MAKRSGKRAAATKDAKAVAVPAAGNIFEHLKLTNVRLLEVNSKLTIAGGLPNRYEINFSCEVAASADPSVVFANVKVEVKGTSDKPDSKSEVVITAFYQCVYKADGIDRDALQPHASVIANVSAMTAWPYLRELVHSISARMSLSPFALPMMMRGPDGAISLALPPTKLTGDKPPPDLDD